MSRLEKKLKTWVGQNLISEEQERNILAYENAGEGGSWVLSGLLILGVLVIGIGIVSVIAANWDKIPASLKLASNFFWLIAIATAIVKTWELKKNVAYEVLIVAFATLCMACIGLISQVFHIGGELYDAVLFWSVITLGVMLASRNKFTPTVWTIALLVALASKMEDSRFFHSNEAAIAMVIPLFAACVAAAINQFLDETHLVSAFRSCAIIGGIIGLVAAETTDSLYTRDTMLQLPFVPAYVFLCLTSIVVLQNRSYSRVQKIFLLLSFALYGTIFQLRFWYLTGSVFYAIITILDLGCMAIFLASLHHRRLFQFFLILIGARFMVLYFQALGGLATTGIGLIISGVILIYATYMWNKYKSRFTTWVERSTQ